MKLNDKPNSLRSSNPLRRYYHAADRSRFKSSEAAPFALVTGSSEQIRAVTFVPVRRGAANDDDDTSY